MVISNTGKNLAFQEIKDAQKSVQQSFSRSAFMRVVREITEEICGKELRFQATALAALQEAAEVFVVDYFAMAYSSILYTL